MDSSETPRNAFVFTFCCARYITEPGRPSFERLLWVFLCCSGLVLAVFFLKPSDCGSLDSAQHWFDAGVEKYINDPTSTTLETTDYPIWNIDFPGVTICPNAKVPKSWNPPKHYLSRSRQADFGRRWKTRTCRGRKYWRMIHRSKDIFRCECCFLNTSETISSLGNSSPSPREFCSVQYWPVHGAKDRSGEELVFFNSTNSQYQN